MPWNVVGTIWQIFARGDIGLLGYVLTQLGIDYNYAQDPTDAWITVLVMDVWHWTPLVALLAYAGAARDSRAVLSGRAHRWRFALGRVSPHRAAEDARRADDRVLLRFMDSFMIYTEPFVLTGGGPGTATTFLSQYLTQKAVGQFDLGPAAAFSLVYFLIILLLCFVLYTFIKDVGTRDATGQAHELAFFPGRVVLLSSISSSRSHPIYWMVHMSLRTNEAITGAFAWFPESLSFANYAHDPHRPRVVRRIHQLDHLRADQHGAVGRRSRCPRHTRSRATPSSATSTCSSGCSRIA